MKSRSIKPMGSNTCRNPKSAAGLRLSGLSRSARQLGFGWSVAGNEDRYGRREVCSDKLRESGRLPILVCGPDLTTGAIFILRNNHLTILGIRFDVGGSDLVGSLRAGGLVQVPSGPGLADDLSNLSAYRDALLGADFVIPDSGLMVLAGIGSCVDRTSRDWSVTRG